MIHFRSFDIIKILKISLPISITLSEKKKNSNYSAARRERRRTERERERESQSAKFYSKRGSSADGIGIPTALLPGPTRAPIVRHRVEFESGGSNGRREEGGGGHSLGGFGVARLESRSAVPRWFIRVGQDQQPGELFSRCVSYLFIGGSESRATILARARRENWGGTLSTLPPPPSSFPLGVLTGKRRGERKSERRGRKWRRRLDGAEAGRRRCASMPSYRLPPPSLLFLCLSVGSASSLCHLPQSFNAVLTYGWICFARVNGLSGSCPWFCRVRRRIVFFYSI